MAEKKILKHGGNVVPEINDQGISEFGDYETYSRTKIDSLVQASGSGGYDWSGKLIYFDGDSLTDGVQGKFSTVCVNKLGCREINDALGGHALFPDDPGSPNSMWDYRKRLTRIPADVDAIVICADFNAAFSIPKTVDECYDKKLSTWAGRWNAALDAIKKSFPTVPVILVSPWLTSHNSSKNEHIIKYNPQAMQTLAKYWGCYFFDLGTESPVNMLYAESVWGAVASDGYSHVHNNQAAADLVGRVLADKIRTIPPYQWTGADSVAISTPTLTVPSGGTGRIEFTRSGDLSIQWYSADANWVPDSKWKEGDDIPFTVAGVMGGTVYGLQPGQATITAKTRSGKKAVCSITVN